MQILQTNRRQSNTIAALAIQPSSVLELWYFNCEEFRGENAGTTACSLPQLVIRKSMVFRQHIINGVCNVVM